MDNNNTSLELIATIDGLEIIEQVPEKPIKYEKANKVIAAWFKMTLNAQKVLAYILSALRGKVFTDREMEMGISVSFTSSEIKRVLVNPNAARRGSFTMELKNIAISLHDTTIIISDEENGEFISFPFIKTCEYKNDSFQVTFHENMSPYLVNLEESGNFTVLDVNHIKWMRHSYTIRIYELCESMAYLARAHDGIIVKKFDLIEFKLMIGLISAEHPAVGAIISQYKKDYYMIGQKIEELYADQLKAIEDIDEKLKHVSESLSESEKDAYIKALQKHRKSYSDKISEIHMYRSVTELRRRVLDVAKKELDQMMDDGKVDVCFDYEMLRKNHTIYGFQMVVLTKGGREKFRMQKESNRQLSLFDYARFNDSAGKKKKSSKNNNSVDHKEVKYIKKEAIPDTLDLLESYFEKHAHRIRLSIKDMYKLACIVDSDVIIDKFEQMEMASEVKNPIGWMMAAIEKNYQKPSGGSKKNSFNDFKQNSYDFAELEKELISN